MVWRVIPEVAGHAGPRLPAFSRAVCPDHHRLHWPPFPSSDHINRTSTAPRYPPTAPIHRPFHLNFAIGVASNMNSLRAGIARTAALQARHFSTTRPASAKVAVLGAAGTPLTHDVGDTMHLWIWNACVF